MTWRRFVSASNVSLFECVQSRRSKYPFRRVLHRGASLVPSGKPGCRAPQARQRVPTHLVRRCRRVADPIQTTESRQLLRLDADRLDTSQHRAVPSSRTLLKEECEKSQGNGDSERASRQNELSLPPRLPLDGRAVQHVHARTHPLNGDVSNVQLPDVKPWRHQLCEASRIGKFLL
eukprot:scaffold191808_cov36-Tisochrysis_lutea.AAC.2